MKQAARLLDLCRARRLRIATAESCTGGLLGAALTAIPGSSDVYERGFITYSNAAKQEMLGVRPEAIEAHGAVSEVVAGEMAEGALRHARAHLAVAITGIAGPGPSEHKPEGRVCFAVVWPGGMIAETVEFGPIGRARVRRGAVRHALGLLARAAESETRIA